MSIDIRGPLAVSRRAQILDALHHDGTVRISDLAARLDVTPVTVRRDIARLAEEGVLRRVHGGATLLQHDEPHEATEPPQSAPSRTTPTTRGIGMLVPSLDYYWPDVVRGAREQARSHGLTITLRGSSYDTDDDRTQIGRLLETAQVDGLVVAPNLTAAHAPETIDWLVSTGVPVVLVERQASAAPHHEPLESVVSDHASGAAVAVRHLADLGHRRIGLVTSEQSPTSAQVRHGWLQASTEAALPVADAVDTSLTRGTAIDMETTIDRVIDDCLASGTTALLVHADTEAIGIAQRCQQRGLVIPDDLSIVAYDDTVAALFSPRLTAVHPPRTSIGAAAVELLAARLADPARPVHRVLISPSLFLRDSVAAPRR